MIVQMKKVKLFFLESEKAAVIDELQAHAVFMPDKKHYQTVNPSNELIQVSKAIEIVEKYIKKSTGNNAIVSLSEFETIDDNILESAKTILDLQNTYYKLEESLKSLKERYEDLLPYQNLTINQARLDSLRFSSVTLGYITKEKYDAFKGHMDTMDAYVDLLSSDDQYNYVSIVIDIDQKERLSDLLESVDFRVEPSRPFEKTNIEVINDFKKEMDALSSEIEKIVQFFQSSSKDLGALKLLHDQLLSKDNKHQLTFLNTESTLYVEGWVRSDKVNQLETLLSDKGLTVEMEARDPLPEESIPTALKNNRFVKPFEYLTNQFSTPSAREVDPNPSMSIWYWVIFGIMMGDIGYGAVMLLLFGGLIRFGKIRGALKDLVQIFAYTGITAMIAGAAFGSLFGNQIYTPLLDPMNDPIPMLIISIALGVLHIMHALVLKMINSVRQKDLLGGLADAGSWLFILTGLSIFVVGSFIPLEQLLKDIMLYTSYVLMGIGALLIILFNGRDKDTIPGKMVSAFTGLYNSTSFLSDILSYSRILALALSTTVIAYTMNLLAGMVWNSIPVLGILLGLVVYLVGHVFNFVMGMLSAYVHAGRLQYLEFFGKFYEGGGYLFEPLQLQLKYVYQVNLKENNQNNKEIN